MSELNTFRIRDRRGSNRYFIDSVFLRGGWGAKVGPYGIAVYNALALHAGYDDQSAWPSYATLAELTGMSARQVIRMIKELQKQNILKKETRYIEDQQTSNEYILTHPDDWRPMTRSHPPYDSQSPPPVTHSHPPYDSQSPKQESVKQESVKELSSSQLMFSAICEVCKIDLRFITKEDRGKVNQTEKLFREEGVLAETIKDDFPTWWYKHDWRGKLDQPPKPSDIRATWGQFEDWQKSKKAPVNVTLAGEALSAYQKILSEERVV